MVDKTSLRNLNYSKEECELSMESIDKLIKLAAKYDNMKDEEDYVNVKQHYRKILKKVNEEIKEYEREEKTDCKHKWIYNQIINVFKNTIKYEITCSKCGYIPPEGYIPDERTEGIIQTLNLSKNQLSKFKNYWSTNKEKEGELRTFKYFEGLRDYAEIDHYTLEEIKIEAIKWIKSFDDYDTEEPEEGFNATEYGSIANVKKWIKNFFNITEEDLE